MPVVDAVLIFLVAPLALYIVIALLAAAPRLGRRPRHRVGQPWTFEPLWWTANPAGARLPAPAEHITDGQKGGARGSW